MLVPRKTLGVLSFTPLTMLQACAQAVAFKVGHHFGEGQLRDPSSSLCCPWRDHSLMGEIMEDHILNRMPKNSKSSQEAAEDMIQIIHVPKIRRALTPDSDCRDPTLPTGTGSNQSEHRGNLASTRIEASRSRPQSYLSLHGFKFYAANVAEVSQRIFIAYGKRLNLLRRQIRL